MIFQIDLPDSVEEFSSIWEPGFLISTKIYSSPQEGETIILSLNKEGLISLARHLLFLAQQSSIHGQHYHFDEYNSLEKGSVELVIEKIK